MPGISIEEDVHNLIAQTIKRFGRIDFAVNNAVTEGKTGPLIDQTVESYTTTFDTNVLGAFLGLKHELKVMIPQGADVGNGEYLPLVGDFLSFNEIIETLNRQGHKLSVKQVPKELFSTFFPGAAEIAEMFSYFQAHTYWVRNCPTELRPRFN